MGSSSGVKIEYRARSDPTDPNDVPVTIVGLASHLAGMATLIDFSASFSQYQNTLLKTDLIAVLRLLKQFVIRPAPTHRDSWLFIGFAVLMKAESNVRLQANVSTKNCSKSKASEKVFHVNGYAFDLKDSSTAMLSTSLVVG